MGGPVLQRSADWSGSIVVSLPAVVAQIVSYNSGLDLGPCLDAIAGQSYEKIVKVLVIDNGSSDDSVSLARLRGVDVIELGRNIGFGAAHNVGYATVKAECDAVLLLNPDMVMDSNCVERLVAASATHSKIAVVGGRYWRAGRNDRLLTLDTCGVVPGRMIGWRDRGAGQRDRGQFSEPGDVGAVSGCCMLFLHGRVGEPQRIFDERFFMYKEDIDLGLTLAADGYISFFEPSATGWHRRGLHQGRVDWRLRRLSARSRLILLEKHRQRTLRWLLDFTLSRLYGAASGAFGEY